MNFKMIILSIYFVFYSTSVYSECSTVSECATEAMIAAQAAQAAAQAAQKALIDALPVGAVIAFDLDKCPKGWSEYKPAYGRFVRGVDRGRPKIDPQGERKAGHVQEDQLKSHYHTVANTAGGEWPHGDDGRGSHLGALQPSRNTSPYGGHETRPKNVALLYCRCNEKN